jgi:hypothetical protein
MNVKRSPSRPIRDALAGWVGMALLGAAWPATAQETGFPPHERHIEVVPICTDCHEGILENDRATFYPSLNWCHRCHVEQEVPEDTWSDRAPRESNLLFRHGFHEEMLGAAAPTCDDCHVPADGPEMAVSEEIQLETCWSCHGGAGTDHMVDARCTTCHMPLSETGFTLERIQRIAPPADHGSASWLSPDHGAAAGEQASRCATCHTSDRCASCHVDAAREPIPSIPAAPPGMTIPEVEARYVTPESHANEGWALAHASGASQDACATCHTANDCTACHVSPLPDAVGQLPQRNEVTAPGVGLLRRAPASHIGTEFMDSHGALSESPGATCETCHEGVFCTQCH